MKKKPDKNRSSSVIFQFYIIVCISFWIFNLLFLKMKTKQNQKLFFKYFRFSLLISEKVNSTRNILSNQKREANARQNQSLNFDHHSVPLLISLSNNTLQKPHLYTTFTMLLSLNPLLFRRITHISFNKIIQHNLTQIERKTHRTDLPDPPDHRSQRRSTPHEHPL